jgi:hypothetical protein
VYGILSVDPLYLTLQNDSVFLDTIRTPQVKYAFYTMTVSPDAPVGTGVDLLYDAYSGNYHTRRVFHQVIGQVTEDWETHTFTKFDWQQGGTLPWTLTGQNPYQGLYSAQSGHIYDYQNSILSLAYTASVDDSISFYYKTSTEQDYDYLMFYIDNVLQEQWSGETPWSRSSFPVSAGTHEFKWRYFKDLAVGGGQDRVWIDFIAFPPPILPSVYTGPDDTICSGFPYLLQAAASTYDSLRWTTDGDGIFSNDTLTNPVYTPGSNDIITGSVYLKLTAWNYYGSYSDRMKLTLAAIPPAVISLLPNDTVCAGNSIFLMADTTGVNHYLWTPGNLTEPVVSIDTTGHGTGTLKMKLTVTNTALCSNTDSVYLTFRDCTGIEEGKQEFSFQIYPNPSRGMFVLHLEVPKPETLTLSIINGSGIRVWTSAPIMVSGKSTQQIDLSDQPAGIYFMTIQRESGSISERIVIRR